MTQEIQAITIDDEEYSLENASDHVKHLLGHLQNIDGQLNDARIKVEQLEVTKTAFANILKTELDG